MAILAEINPTYQPAMRIISSITNDNPALVTTTFEHNYITGLIIRLKIPCGFGMLQADGLEAEITVVDTTSFYIHINSLPFDIYVTPATYPDDKQFAQVIPTGEISDILLGATRNVLR